MEAKTIEVVTFDVKAGVSKKEASRKLAGLNELVKNYEGFIKRDLSCNEDGKWVDIVYWTSKELALKAASEVASNEKAAEIFAIIDENSVKMNHYEIINSSNQ